MNSSDTIAAISTSPGMGAIAVIRLSGEKARSVLATLFYPIAHTPVDQMVSHQAYLGWVKEEDTPIDEVMAIVYRAPRSYTGEDMVEISCHGSTFIQQKILTMMIYGGARLAEPGEFTLRAFLNGKMDLTQAEAVSDLIASESQSAHKVALDQMRGGFSKELMALREAMLEFASLIELELDFAEEEVEFADRKALMQLLEQIQKVITRLRDSFDLGNVLKNGVPVALVGAPNAGKSTLLNALLNEERALVSEIAGTTRDSIEEELTLMGIKFRFIDTAGIRETTDAVEQMGITRTFEKAAKARIVCLLADANKILEESKAEEFKNEVNQLRELISDEKIILLLNKTDLLKDHEINELKLRWQRLTSHLVIGLSAATGTGMEDFKNTLLEITDTQRLSQNDTIITNLRHFEALGKAQLAINQVKEGMNAGLSGDLLALDLREALRHLGSITGAVDSDEILGAIFSRFCIGK